MEKNVLTLDDDVAQAIWGGSWRMPTRKELDELCNATKCDWQWYPAANTEFGGVAGWKVISKIPGFEGNFIFLPLPGVANDKSISSVGTSGRYWSRTLSSSELMACYLNLSSGDHSTSSINRYYGQSVRPVFQ